MIPVLVLNLPRDGKRRVWMNSHLRALGIPHTVVPGVDGRKIPDEDALPDMIRFRRSHGREMTRGELGCAYAYQRILREIAAGADSMVCVMEDDIEVASAAVQFLDERILARVPTFDVLRLFSNEHRQHKPAWSQATILGRAVVAPLRTGWGTYAQIFTREGARKLADQPITAPIDCMIYYDCPPPGLRILEIRPSLVRRDAISGSNTEGSEKDASQHSLRSKFERPLWPRVHFVRTWGLQGIMGLIQSPYRPPAEQSGPPPDGRRSSSESAMAS